MSQRDHARQMVCLLMGNAGRTNVLADLRTVLEEAQNGPPEGAADGSIDEAMWNDLKSLADGFAQVQGALARIEARR